VGYNPVIWFSSWEKPDGRLADRTEWQWKLVDGAYVPAAIKHMAHEDGAPETQRDATLEDCVLNQPLDPHQFDYEGLGLKDGDMINDHIDRVYYTLKNGKLVKLGDFVR
jgi:hypothetical protein